MRMAGRGRTRSRPTKAGLRARSAQAAEWRSGRRIAKSRAPGMLSPVDVQGLCRSGRWAAGRHVRWAAAIGAEPNPSIQSGLVVSCHLTSRSHSAISRSRPRARRSRDVATSGFPGIQKNHQKARRSRARRVAGLPCSMATTRPSAAHRRRASRSTAKRIGLVIS